jgi:CheY-like chemotaxis protein
MALQQNAMNLYFVISLMYKGVIRPVLSSFVFNSTDVGNRNVETDGRSGAVQISNACRSGIAMQTTRQNIVRTVRLTDQQSRRLLDMLDKAELQNTANNQVKESFPFRTHIKLHILTHAGTEETCYLVPTRTLSCRELSFLHGGYLHQGTLCLAELCTTHKKRKEHFAQVASCKYITGQIHEVIIQFDQEIMPSNYCEQAISIRCLLVEKNKTMIDQVASQLQKYRIRIEYIDTVHEVIKKALESPYNLLLMNMEMPGMNGISAVRLLRKREFTGMIVAVTNKNNLTDFQEFWDAGCNHVLHNDYAPHQIDQILEELRQRSLANSKPESAH